MVWRPGRALAIRSKEAAKSSRSKKVEVKGESKAGDVKCSRFIFAFLLLALSSWICSLSLCERAGERAEQYAAETPHTLTLSQCTYRRHGLQVSEDMGDTQ